MLNVYSLRDYKRAHTAMTRRWEWRAEQEKADAVEGDMVEWTEESENAEKAPRGGTKRKRGEAA